MVNKQDYLWILEEEEEEEEEAQPTESERITKLEQEIQNLNKGISSYRGEAHKTKKELADARKKIEELEQSGSGSEDQKSGKGANEDDLPPLSKKDQALLEQWANEKGFVSKAELEKERERMQSETLRTVQETAVNDFLQQHPEYDSDEEWKKVSEQFALYKQPTTLKGFNTILKKIHADLSKDTKKEDDDDDAEARAKARLANRRALQAGGRSGSGGGDDDNSIEALMDRYPRLTRAQIQERKKELEGLYPKKK